MRIDRIKLVTQLTKQDITQKELAKRSGVSRATINYVKSGKSCSDEVAQKIANGLGIPLKKIIE